MEASLKNKRILVTGCSGYIGMHLVKNLVEFEPILYLLAYEHNEELDSLIKNHKIKFLECDLTNKADLRKYSNILDNVDIVLHLAAYVPKKVEDDDFFKSLDINLYGTMNLANCLKENSKFIFISTCEVYGTPIYDIIKENHPLNPLSYYGVSKVVAEKALEVYSKKNNINLTILRIANVYGPRESINRAIPNFIKSVLKNKSPLIFGDGSDKRDFIYIDDAVWYIIATILKGKNTIYNIASGKIYTIKEIAEKIIKLSKSNVQIKFEKRKKAKLDYIFDITKAKTDLQYIPKTDIDKGLLKEIEWFKTMGDFN